MIPIQDKGESRELFEWVKASELKEIDWPVCVRYDGGGAPYYTTVCSMRDLHALVSPYNPIEEIYFAEPIQSSLKEETENLVSIIASNLYNIHDHSGRHLMDTGKCDEVAQIIFSEIQSSLTPKSIREHYEESVPSESDDKIKELEYSLEMLADTLFLFYKGEDSFADSAKQNWTLDFVKHRAMETLEKYYYDEDKSRELMEASLKPNKLTDSEIEKMAEDYSEENGERITKVNEYFTQDALKSGFIAGAQAIIGLNK